MSKFEVAESDIQHYVAPEITGRIVGLKEEVNRAKTVEEMAREEKQKVDTAIKQGRQKGYAEGLKKGEQEIKEKARQLQTIINFLQKPLKDLDQQVETQLTELTLLLAKQLLQKESTIDAQHIHNLVHDSLEYLPVNTREIEVHLNARDIELLKASELDVNEQSWRCVADEKITQGGCIIESSASHIDATVEKRIEHLVEQLGLEAQVDVQSENENAK